MSSFWILLDFEFGCMQGKTFRSSNTLLLLIMFTQFVFVEVGICVLLPLLHGDLLHLQWFLLLIRVPENPRVGLSKRVGREVMLIGRVT